MQFLVWCLKGWKAVSYFEWICQLPGCTTMGANSAKAVDLISHGIAVSIRLGLQLGLGQSSFLAAVSRGARVEQRATAQRVVASAAASSSNNPVDK